MIEMMIEAEGLGKRFGAVTVRLAAEDVPSALGALRRAGLQASVR